MLSLEGKSKRRHFRIIIPVVAGVLLLSGGYLLSLTLAPTIIPLIAKRQIVVTDLPAPQKSDNRIIIPKLGVSVPYAPGISSLDRGAQWRNPENGNPSIGGNFIIAAHRFSIQPTPMATVEKSPFYSIDKLVIGDKIIVDYSGVRYAYEIKKIFDVSANQIDIEDKSDTPLLTLYSCELGGSESGRVVVTAVPLGKVALTDDEEETLSH